MGQRTVEGKSPNSTLQGLAAQEGGCSQSVAWRPGGSNPTLSSLHTHPFPPTLHTPLRHRRKPMLNAGAHSYDPDRERSSHSHCRSLEQERGAEQLERQVPPGQRPGRQTRRLARGQIVGKLCLQTSLPLATGITC